MRSTIYHLREQPVSVYFVQCEPSSSGLVDNELANELFDRLAIPFLKTGYTLFRGVNFSRLPVILKTGIDVEPSDSVFYSAEFDKALEYGGWPKIVLALHGHCLTKTFKEVPADIGKEELASIRNKYPTVITSDNGTHLWCSRLAETDENLCSTYEADSAWWIEGDALRALKGIIVLSKYEDTDTNSRVKSMFGDR